jgi:hypothetical protein
MSFWFAFPLRLKMLNISSHIYWPFVLHLRVIYSFAHLLNGLFVLLVFNFWALYIYIYFFFLVINPFSNEHLTKILPIL